MRRRSQDELQRARTVRRCNWPVFMQDSPSRKEANLKLPRHRELSYRNVHRRRRRRLYQLRGGKILFICRNCWLHCRFNLRRTEIHQDSKHTHHRHGVRGLRDWKVLLRRKRRVR